MEPEGDRPGTLRIAPGSGALIGALEGNADIERARLLAAAETRVSQIEAAAEAECDRMKTEGMARLEHELAAEQQRLLGEARMEARAAGLASRRSLLAEAFQRAEAEISRLRSGPGAAAVLSALAEEARAAVGEPCTVEVSADGQVTATSADGRRRGENSLDGRLLRAQAAAEPEVARRLFGGPNGNT